ncbi:MAG: terminase gpA endonuclease subunit, partial [Oryzomonas sp.]
MFLLSHEIEIPPFLLPETIDLLDGKSVDFDLPAAIKAALRQPEKISVSDCAAQYRVVTAVDAQPGPWNNDEMPHTVKPMNTYAQPWVKEIWLCWPERAGKTNVMLNCLSWTKLFDSGNIFWLDPSEDDTGKNVKTKIIPMFRESEHFRDCLSARADDTGKGLIAFQDGTYLFPAHSNSARSMSNFFGLHNFGNEVDKYPPMTGSETNPINLIRKRGRDVGRSKFMFSSTPAGRHIYKGTMACRQIWQLSSKCPHCGDFVLMDDEHLVIPKEATVEQVENGEAPLCYACNACGAEWDEEDRRESFIHGKWVCTKGEDSKRPRSIGFHASALPFPMVPLMEYCAKYLRSKSGDQSDKVDYAHGYRVVDYEEDKADRKEDAILKLVDDHLPRAIVPPDISTIIILADTQQTGFMYQVLAIGYGSDPAPALIDHGFLETFEQLKEKGEEIFLDAQETEYRAHAGFIDSGGGTNPYKPKHSRTSEVYEFCRTNKFWRPLKGRRSQATPWSITRLDFFPSRDGKKRPIPGGLNLYTINVTLYKNQLATKLAINPGDPGALRLHAGVSEDGPHSGQKYAAQLCAEYRDERGYWECPNGKANHFWDCWVYGFAGADILGVR